jgi:hypothetical protein
MKKFLCGAIAVAGVTLLALMQSSLLPSSRVYADLGAVETGPEPVEKDMHEFMEYVFQPTYKRLKASIAVTPADNSVWKAIKADSLILAEAGNLLLARLPEADVQAWKDISVSVRSSGGELYRSAKSKDYAAARKHYEAMLKNCNICHNKFAHGEHQLTP